MPTCRARIRRSIVILAGVMLILVVVPAPGAKAVAPYSVSLAASASSLGVGESVVLTATANQNIGPTPYYITIFNSSGDQLETCGTGTTCTTSASTSVAESDTFTAYISDASGGDIQATSNSVTVTWGGSSVPSTGGSGWTATATAYRGSNGSRYTFTCPAGGAAGSVWGTDTYTDDSSVCTAAVHAGVITRAGGGSVTIEIQAGRSSYTGSTRNGISSGSWGSWSGSFVVIGATSSPTGTFSVTLSASDNDVPTGTSVTLTATSSQDVGSTPYYINIVTEDGFIEESCGYGTTCEVSVYSDDATTIWYTAYIADANDDNVQATSDELGVTWTSDELLYTVSLSASDTTVAVGDPVTLTALTNQDVGPSPYYINIVADDGYIERTCGYGTSCAVTISWDEPDSWTYTAYVSDFDVNDVQASSDEVTVTWSGTAIDGLLPDVTRLAGADRFATSALLSSSGFDPGVPVAYLATGMSFADALAGGAAAAAEGGPVLTTRRDDLPDSVAEELARLDPDRVVVLGGTAAVSDAVAQRAGEVTGASVIRVAGADRYSTAAAISQRLFPAGVSAVFIATGASFADALSGGVAAAALGGPVLLVGRDTLPASTATELGRLDPATIYVLGSTTVVSDAVLAQLQGYAADGVTRYAGADRYATAATVSAATFGDRVGRLYLATGESFADALAGVALAGHTGSPMLLVRPSCVPAPVGAEITRLDPAEIVILGGNSAVGASVESLLPC